MEEYWINLYADGWTGNLYKSSEAAQKCKSTRAVCRTVKVQVVDEVAPPEKAST